MIDLTYVGPNPALNAYIRSHGEEIRVLAGAAEGGAALVGRTADHIKRPADLRGKQIATPQLGGTQDVATRAWLKKQGFAVTHDWRGRLRPPTANPDQLGLFQTRPDRRRLDGQTWVSRLELEAGGRIFLEQTDAITTILVSSVKFLRDPSRACGQVQGRAMPS